MATKIKLSNEVWDEVLRAVGLERDVDEPMTKMTIILENQSPVVVVQEKYVSDDNGNS